MPTQVQNPPNDPFPRAPHGTSPGFPEHDAAGPAKSREALRLALGSILTPKRPYTPSSRSSSGTTSPAYPFSTPPLGTPSIPPAPHSTPSSHVPSGRFSDSHLNPFPHHPNPHPHSHPHVPSRLSRSESHPDVHDTSSSVSSSQCPSPVHRPGSAAGSPTHEMSLAEAAGGARVHADGTVSAPIPIPGGPVATTVDGAHTPGGSKVTFFQTLQSKSAWEALIHGSMS
ncbi:hypothetical protein HGRIS_007011 [Hohenbuehelia grisea]|uniref:Uncharacterized protein n=1 Tax=Hohenbuehelia grisea TaxID=104357 RepID=A0ABR3JAR7_9AGAR